MRFKREVSERSVKKSYLSRISAIVLVAILALVCSPMLGAEAPTEGTETVPVASGEAIFVLSWAVAFVGSIIALIFAWRFFKSVMAADEGNEEMIEIAEHVRTGAIR